MSRTLIYHYLRAQRENPTECLLLPATKLGQGYIFTGLCDSVHRGGLPQCMLGYNLPREQAPPRRRACWEIRSTRGQYASYWNAILFLEYQSLKFTIITPIKIRSI